MGFMMQATFAESNVILSKFWHKILETNDNLTHHKDKGLFINAGKNFPFDTILAFLLVLAIKNLITFILPRHTLHQTN
jgi:hypothetical protein